MYQNIKKKWIEALRSGEYKQGRESLKTTNEHNNDSYYCCLGVLCDIHSRGTNTVWSGHPNYPVSNYLGCEAFLPHTVIRWAGLEDKVRLVVPYPDDCVENNVDITLPNGQQTSATKLNDDMGLSFVEIADIIESGVKEVPETTNV